MNNSSVQLEDLPPRPDFSGEKRDRALAALLLIIKAEAVSRELQGSANLTEAQAPRISEPSEV